jgi:hypothetical protein
MSARTEPWWTHHPDHMKGWEAYGVVGTEPDVRRLGLVTFIKGTATTEERPGTEPWGSGEVKLGVAGIEIGTFADSTDGAYIHVVGTTKVDVAAAWKRAESAFVSVAELLWPKSRAPGGSVTATEDKQ